MVSPGPRSGSPLEFIPLAEETDLIIPIGVGRSHACLQVGLGGTSGSRSRRSPSTSRCYQFMNPGT